MKCALCKKKMKTTWVGTTCVTYCEDCCSVLLDPPEKTKRPRKAGRRSRHKSVTRLNRTVPAGCRGQL